MLNQNQIEAISHKEGPAIVLAGPGSGKTTVITHRVKNLIEKFNVSPEKILVVTFTKAAAQQMQRRFHQFMNENKGIEKTYSVTFGTFHSVYYKILRMACRYKNTDIVTEREKNNYIREIVIRLKIDVNSMAEFTQNACSEISKIKGNKLDIEEYYPSCCDKEQFILLFREYEKSLTADGKIDFDDMLLKCYQLLMERNDILKQWQEIFQYILIDEFQDINSIQYEIIKMLAEPQNNIFIVGDDDQSVYGFRGACPKIMFQFKQDFENAKEILLNINYRSVPEIVLLAENLISKNKQRFEKNMIAEHKNGKEPDIRKFKSQSEELKYLCNQIKNYIKEGISPNDMAILVRNNSQTEIIRKFLWNEKIQVKALKNTKSIYDSMVAKDIFSYIRAALFDLSGPLCKNTDLIFILNKPTRFISRQAIGSGSVGFDELKSIYSGSPQILKNIEQLQFHLNMISKLNPSAALIYIRNGTGYEKYLREYAAEKHIKLANLYEQFDIMQQEAAKFKTMKDWLEYVEMQENNEEMNVDAGVNIMTMHGAKGLEFRAVFIVDANQGIIPSLRAVREKDIDEERRVFYVALTRAKELLGVYGFTESLGCPVELSVFVAEMLETE